jgi:hypothetical protein
MPIDPPEEHPVHDTRRIGSIHQKAIELRLDRIAVRYLGEYSEHMVLGL